MPYNPHFDHRLGCWTLRSYLDVRNALEDSRFAISPSPLDEFAHSHSLRRSIDSFDLAAWRNGLLQIPFRGDAHELVTEVAEPWCHAAALRIAGLEGDRDDTLALARASFDANADAGAKLASILPPVLGPLTVQAFVAVSQSLTAFLANSWIVLLRTRSNPSIEELLRVAGPSQFQLRYLIADVDGMLIGSKVALMIAEANRECDARTHLAFGHGPHACVGAMLIRAAAAVAMPLFTQQYGTMELEEVVLPSESVPILKPLRVTVRRGNR